MVGCGTSMAAASTSGAKRIKEKRDFIIVIGFFDTAVTVDFPENPAVVKFASIL